MGRAPRPAADALVGLLRLERAEFIGDRRVQGDPRRRGSAPHNNCLWSEAIRRKDLRTNTTAQFAIDSFADSCLLTQDKDSAS